MTKPTTALADRFARSLERHDVDELDEWIALDYVQHNPYVAQGRDGVRSFFDAWHQAFTDTEVIVEDALVAGDRLVGRFTYRARHTGEFMGIPPSGNEVEMRSIDIWRVVDGKLVEHWDEINTAEFFAQLGGFPTTSPVD
ncbi:MAG: ester cyclase [Actinomycetota bacterium]